MLLFLGFCPDFGQNFEMLWFLWEFSKNFDFTKTKTQFWTTFILNISTYFHSKFDFWSILAIFTKITKISFFSAKNMTSKESRFRGRNFENFSKIFFSRKKAFNCEQLSFWTSFHTSHRLLSKVHFSNKFEKCYSKTKKNFEFWNWWEFCILAFLKLFSNKIIKSFI